MTEPDSVPRSPVFWSRAFSLYFSNWRNAPHWCDFLFRGSAFCCLWTELRETLSSVWTGSVLHRKAASWWAFPLAPLTVSQCWAVSYVPYTCQQFGPEDRNSPHLFGDSHHHHRPDAAFCLIIFHRFWLIVAMGRAKHSTEKYRRTHWQPGFL